MAILVWKKEKRPYWMNNFNTSLQLQKSSGEFHRCFSGFSRQNIWITSRYKTKTRTENNNQRVSNALFNFLSIGVEKLWKPLRGQLMWSFWKSIRLFFYFCFLKATLEAKFHIFFQYCTPYLSYGTKIFHSTWAFLKVYLPFENVRIPNIRTVLTSKIFYEQTIAILSQNATEMISQITTKIGFFEEKPELLQNP